MTNAALLAVAAHAATPTLMFDQIFAAAGEPRALRYDVVYASHGVHHLTVWRDRDRHVKRVTDQAIVSLATHQPRDAGYRLTIVDRTKRIATTIDRTNLYRVGNFTDWFDLGHGLRHPKGPYTLTKASAPAGMPRAIAPCDWYRLVDGARTSAICWDARHRVPLLIAAGDARPIWRVTRLDPQPVPESLFRLDTRGFTLNNANRDIERD